MLIKTGSVSWLPNSVTKGFGSPTIEWEPRSSKYGGYYRRGTESIVVVEEYEENQASTIAHEFRHYIQDRIGTMGKIKPLDHSLSYTDMIKKYFRNSWHEYDALLFEYKHAKTDLNEWWLRKLVWEN